MKIFSILPWADWLALVCFFALWVGYAWFAKALGQRRSSLLITTNRYRGYWMKQAAMRDPRMLDGLITQTLSNTPAFFSSTSILVIGGLFALLGTTDKATELMSEIPFAQATPLIVFEFKILVLVSIFVYAFFRFSCCMRQYTFVALVIGAMPNGFIWIPSEASVGAGALRKPRTIAPSRDRSCRNAGFRYPGLCQVAHLRTSPSGPFRSTPARPKPCNG